MLDLSLQAERADVTPLLSLVPQLAALGVGAQGSLSLEATGTLGEPQLELTSPNLRLRLAGSSYRLTGTKVTLEDEDLDINAALEGVAPIGGDLTLQGGGQLSLSPYNLQNFVLAFQGAATLPVLGAVQGISGEVTTRGGDWLLGSQARLGRPVTLSGRLLPLDLELRGDNLNLNAQNFFVASSSTDLAIDIARRGEDFVISGDVVVDAARLTPAREQTAGSGSANGSGSGAGEAPEDANATPQPTSRTQGRPAGAPLNADVEPGENSGAGGVSSSATSSTTPDTGAVQSVAPQITPNPTPNPGVSNSDAGEALPASPPASAATPAGPNPVLQRVLFEEVNILAQSSVQFRAGFGTAELTFDLDLTGTAAAPELSGAARILQGTVRFSGKDFVIEEGTATFQPSGGVFPTLDLEARATFDKGGALGNLRNRYEFIEPREGATFNTQLSVAGTFEEVDGQPRPVLDLEPSLSSDAVVQEQGSGTPRPLEEPELVSLLTLGRLQLGQSLSGADSLAGTVAESALDTAVDFLVLSELQSALGDALGVGLFEIRTSALSSLLDSSRRRPLRRVAARRRLHRRRPLRQLGGRALRRPRVQLRHLERIFPPLRLSTLGAQLLGRGQLLGQRRADRRDRVRLLARLQRHASYQLRGWFRCVRF